jgi:hypothetical protein
MYAVIDTHTGRRVGIYGSRTRAYRYADRRDAEYGAVRYIVRPIIPATLGA